MADSTSDEFDFPADFADGRDDQLSNSGMMSTAEDNIPLHVLAKLPFDQLPRTVIPSESNDTTEPKLSNARSHIHHLMAQAAGPRHALRRLGSQANLRQSQEGDASTRSEGRLRNLPAMLQPTVSAASVGFEGDSQSEREEVVGVSPEAAPIVTRYMWRPHRRKHVDWTEEETSDYYNALSQFGLDFSAIAILFPGRDRIDMKQKYKKESRLNPEKVQSALTQPKPIDMTHFEVCRKKCEELNRPAVTQLNAEEEGLLRAIASGGGTAAPGESAGAADSSSSDFAFPPSSNPFEFAPPARPDAQSGGGASCGETHAAGDSKFSSATAASTSGGRVSAGQPPKKTKRKETQSASESNRIEMESPWDDAPVSSAGMDFDFDELPIALAIQEDASAETAKDHYPLPPTPHIDIDDLPLAALVAADFNDEAHADTSHKPKRKRKSRTGTPNALISPLAESNNTVNNTQASSFAFSEDDIPIAFTLAPTLDKKEPGKVQLGGSARATSTTAPPVVEKTESSSIEPNIATPKPQSSQPQQFPVEKAFDPTLGVPPSDKMGDFFDDFPDNSELATEEPIFFGDEPEASELQSGSVVAAPEIPPPPPFMPTVRVAPIEPLVATHEDPLVAWDDAPIEDDEEEDDYFSF